MEKELFLKETIKREEMRIKNWDFENKYKEGRFVAHREMSSKENREWMYR